MTSGNFTTFPVDKVWVNREKRQRRELHGIPELAESIKRTGLIHPPVILRTGELIAGERRWNAMKLLGWTHMPIQYADELSEVELHVIELEENVRREDVPWQDQCLAVERYHKLRAEQDAEWTSVKTAEALGFSAAEVSHKRAVAKEIEAGNERVVAAPKYSVARGIVQRDTERRKASTVKGIAVDNEAEPEPAAPLLHADFHEWQKAYKGEPFNLIHCDFPYGVNIAGHGQTASGKFGGYVDNKEDYWKLLETLEAGMKNVVAESAHLIFWFSMDYYQQTAVELTKMGWSVNPFPLIWFKADNTGVLPDPHRGPRRLYETAFFASRGDRKIVQAVGNCTAAGVDKSIHMSEKNPNVLRHFMRMVVDEYSTVLDPTCGSGNAVKVAASLGANRVLGIERDEEFYNLAKEHWDA